MKTGGFDRNMHVCPETDWERIEICTSKKCQLGKGPEDAGADPESDEAERPLSRARHRSLLNGRLFVVILCYFIVYSQYFFARRFFLPLLNVVHTSRLPSVPKVPHFQRRVGRAGPFPLAGR